MTEPGTRAEASGCRAWRRRPLALAAVQLLAACDSVLDVGTFIGATSSRTVPVPSEPMPIPPSGTSGTVDSGLAPGPVTSMDSGAVEGPGGSISDSGVFDSGLSDSGVLDSGLVDSGLLDAGGNVEAGRLDSGTDAATLCTSAPLPPLADDAGMLSPSTVTLPWTTDFENGFCDYSNVDGYCYASPLAVYELVESPVRSGRYSAAFRVTPMGAEEQSRCVLNGQLPQAAYYGAWYYLPEPAEATGNWNLFHFRGGDATTTTGIWDVSLGNDDAGQLALYVRDPSGAAVLPESPRLVPVGAWFHIEFLLRRAADATGEVALYQDGQLLLRLIEVVTDDGVLSEWYVGNLSDGVVPADYTLYVDDVSVRAP